MKFAPGKTPKRLLSGLVPYTGPANLLETPSAFFWRNMYCKYLPFSHENPRLTRSGLGEYIDRRYRQCCRFRRGQQVVLTDREYGRIIGKIQSVQSCWSFFEIYVKVSQGKYKDQVLKLGRNIAEIRLAQAIPDSPSLF